MTKSEKFQLAKKVAQYYSNNPSGFSLIEFSIENDIESSVLSDEFSSKEALFAAYYEYLPSNVLSNVNSIDGWEDFTLAEKLTMLIHTSFDEFEEVLPFVRDTFVPIITKSDKGVGAKHETTHLLKELFSSDQRTSSYIMLVHFDILYEFYFTEYGHLVKFWLKDSSIGKEKTLALTDKLTGFIQEVVYNNIFDRGIDLARFFLDNRIIKLPFGIDTWFK